MDRPWENSAQPWYAYNTSDYIKSGMLDDIDRQNVYRSSSEARYQERYNMYHNIETFSSGTSVDISRKRREKLLNVGHPERQEHMVDQNTLNKTIDKAGDVRFLPGQAEIFMYIGDKEQDPIPFRGNVPEGVAYPELTNYLMFGCQSIDCRDLQKFAQKKSTSFKPIDR